MALLIRCLPLVAVLIGCYDFDSFGRCLGAAPAGCPDGGAPAACFGCVQGGPYNYVFLTSTTYVPGTLGGVAGADSQCNALAQAAHLPGQFRAWLSTSTVDAKARLVTQGGQAASGWVRPDHRPFAASLDQMLSGAILNPLRIDETGIDQYPAADTVFVATGTNRDGTRNMTQTAGDWMTMDFYASGVATATTFGWTAAAASVPDQKAHLYCFGIDYAQPLPPVREMGRTAFLSQTGFSTGNGVAPADASCQKEANDTGLTGSYKALLSTHFATAPSRFDLSGPPWVRLDGIPWVKRAQDLLQGNLLTALNVDTSGAFRVDWEWTGSTDPSTTLGDNCNDWMSTSGSVSGIVGTPTDSDTGFWNPGSSYNQPCNFQYAFVYCLQE
jgi:hypothetical protein